MIASATRKRLAIVLSCITVVLLGVLLVLSRRTPDTSAKTESFPFGETLPEYDGQPSVIVHDNKVTFEEMHKESYTSLQELDALGRCQRAEASIGPDTLTYDERGSMGMVRPSGWNTARYDDLIEDHYLFNRCHLLGYALTGIVDDARNLITGTRYMNVEGMLVYEVQLARYIQKTGNHVEYHVTPVFLEDELVCRGVLLEARSVEDNGKGLEFCVYCFNVQPGIIIDYTDGTSEREQSITRSMPSPSLHYVVNIRSGKFHYEDCEGVKGMSEKNRKDVTCTREELLEQGYEPCGTCAP